MYTIYTGWNESYPCEMTYPLQDPQSADLTRSMSQKETKNQLSKFKSKKRIGEDTYTPKWATVNNLLQQPPENIYNIQVTG